MKIPILFLQLGGVINLLVGVLHCFFWKLFSWQSELKKLSVENSNIVQMLNLFCIVFFFYSSILLIFKPYQFLSNAIGRAFVGLFATLFLARLAMEFYFPAGSIGFAAFLLFTVFLFPFPLIKTNTSTYANQ